MLNFVTLSLTPTALFGLNSELKIPKSFNFISNAKPSLFKYPEFLKADDKKKQDRVETVELSTTAMVKRKTKKDMDVDTPHKTPTKDKDDPIIADEPLEKQDEKPKENPEATFESQKNPS